MRDVTDATADHLTPDTAADLDEGLLEPDVAAAARAHVAGCASCAALLAELAHLRHTLAADDPGPIPLDVADRLDTALATASRTSARPGSPPRRVWVRPALSLAAGVVALAALVGGLRTLSGSSTAGGGSAASSANPGAAAAGGMSDNGGPSPRAPLTARTPSPGPAVTATSSGTTYAASDPALLRQAEALLRRDAEHPGSRAQTGRPTDLACVQALPGPAPVLVDEGRYAGHRALLVVQRTDGHLVATVLPRPCSARDAARPLRTAAGRAGR